MRAQRLAGTPIAPVFWWVLFSLMGLGMGPVLLAQSAPSEYGKLLAELKGGNTQIDFTRLRMSWVESPERKQAKVALFTTRQMTAALEAKDYAKALASAEEVLASEYVNIDAHMVASIALK